MPLPPPSARQLRQRGAALLILLAMLSIGGAMLLMSAPWSQSADRLHEKQTQQRLAEAREALIGFATQHGRLPRPARSALDGTENPVPCATAQGCNGFLPWVTLGIEGADGWGRLLRYSVTPVFTTAPIRAVTTGGDKTISTRDSRGLMYYLVGQAECPIYVQCAPAILYSSGKNAPGTSTLGISQLSPANSNLDEQYNAAAISNFISRQLTTAPEAPGGEFDDVVTWVPIQTLYDRMRAAHRL